MINNMFAPLPVLSAKDMESIVQRGMPGASKKSIRSAAAFTGRGMRNHIDRDRPSSRARLSLESISTLGTIEDCEVMETDFGQSSFRRITDVPNATGFRLLAKIDPDLSAVLEAFGKRYAVASSLTARSFIDWVAGWLTL